MRRSDFYFKVLAAVLFVAVAAYIGLYIFKSVENPFQTTVASAISVEDTGACSGFFVRTESAVRAEGGTCSLSAGEGEKVHAGQVIATEYLSDSALQRGEEILSLKTKIAQLEEKNKSGDKGFSKGLQTAVSLSEAVAHKRFDEIGTLVLDVESYIFTGSRAAAGESLEALKERLSALEARDDGTRVITAPVSGTFSGVTDGFENVSPKDVANISPDGLYSLFPEKTGGGARPVGKLVTDIKWRFAAVMTVEDAARLSQGAEFSVSFAAPISIKVVMRVESIGVVTDGRRVVVFSADKSLADIVSKREAQAEVIFSEYSGIGIPREAIRLDDSNKTFVFLLTGVRAEKVYVEIIGEFGDSYIVKNIKKNEDDKQEQTTLREGATVIVRANGLENGKVVVD